MADLSIVGLCKSFGDHRVLDDVSIEAGAGELLTLLGPSGCGKSTTLWAIGGLHRPDGGSIRIGGEVMFDASTNRFVPPERRGCGVVFQSYAVWPNMTVAENVGYPLGLRRIKGAARAARVAEMLELVELGELAGRYPHQLSGGQQQRVALARALAHPPKLLLLDEPFSNLDAKLRERARVWLRARQREIGVTTVFVTHDQDEALSMSDRVAVMNGGRIVQVDTPERVYREPADLFVADFVGTVNCLAADCGEQRDGRVLVHVAGLAVPLWVERPTSMDDNAGRVTVAFRPESVVVHQHGSATTSERLNVIDARVLDVAFLGDRYSYRVDVAGTPVMVQTSHPVPNDGRLTIELPPGRLRLYPIQETIDA